MLFWPAGAGRRLPVPASPILKTRRRRVRQSAIREWTLPPRRRPAKPIRQKDRPSLARTQQRVSRWAKSKMEQPASKASKPPTGDGRRIKRPQGFRPCSSPNIVQRRPATSRSKVEHAGRLRPPVWGIVVALGSGGSTRRPALSQPPPVRFGCTCAAIGLVLGWFIFRLVRVPPVRRVPDRHRSRDEQGLVDQPRRPLSRDRRWSSRPSS